MWEFSPLFCIIIPHPPSTKAILLKLSKISENKFYKVSLLADVMPGGKWNKLDESENDHALLNVQRSVYQIIIYIQRTADLS